MENLKFFLEYTRAYSLPMSVMAWVIAFSYAIFNGGNILYGILAFWGIACAHLGANLFDDIVDYKKYVENKETGKNINLKKGKCKNFLDNRLSVAAALKTTAVLFSIAIFVGLFFVYLYKLPVLFIMAIAGILCLLYPKSGYFGLSEIIIGIVFSPLLFTGVFYVMTGQFSSKLEWLSISFALVVVCLLYTDFFLDFNSDKKAGKMTLPIISGSKQNAYYLYVFIVFLIYANLFFGIHAHVFSGKYFVIFVSVLFALRTIKNLLNYIDKEIESEKSFLEIMNDVQKFASVFSVLCILAFYLDKTGI